MAQTKPKAGQFYGVSGNGTDGQFLQTDGAGGMAWADTTVAPTLTSIDYPGTATAADTAGGESIIINGTGFQTGITCTVGGTSATTAFNSATQITITSPAKAAGQYTVAVTNTDGGNGSSNNFIQYSGVPIWSTASGSLGSVEEGASASFQVTATEGSDTIEYAVTSGSLPSGLSLNTNTGAITGTAPSVSANTTSTFSITATDDENQTSSARSFSITVNAILPSQHFNTTLYTGTGSTLAITGVSFQPDMVWVKNYGTAGYNHCVQDSVRGPSSNLYILYPDGTWAQATNTTSDYFQSLNSDGFSVGGNAYFGGSSNSYVGYSFRGGGAPTATNSAGAGNAPTLGSVMIDDSASTATLPGTNPITKLSANTTLGYSMVELSKTNTNSETFAHGLGVVPEMIILKRTVSADDWYVYHKDLGNTVRISLNSTAAKVTGTGVWDSTTPTSSVFSLQNQSGGAHMAYCFASQAGFSKVGSFTGDGTSSKIIETGFRVGWVLIKNTDATYRWYLLDDKRGGSSRLFANNNDPANTSQETVKFLENGFEITTSDAEVNQSGSTMIYLAFASDGSATTPSLANSFDTELFDPTTSSSPLSVTGMGFKPDFVWAKYRNGAQSNYLVDSVRGLSSLMYSDRNDAAYTASPYVQSFDADGITYVNNLFNRTGTDACVAWGWKAGGLGSINTDGTGTTIVSANQAAGFSIVTGNIAANGYTATLGHGLASQPELVIYKPTSITSDWYAFSEYGGSLLGNNNVLKLNTDGASTSDSLFDTTSTTFKAGASSSAHAFVAYCFVSIANFSKIGTYAGDGNTSGNVITTGFEPSFLMVKPSDATGYWYILDNARNTSNPRNTALFPNDNLAEITSSNYDVDFLSTGFELKNNTIGFNQSGVNYIYMAIKQN